MGTEIKSVGTYQTYEQASQAAGEAVTGQTINGGDKSETATVVYHDDQGYHYLTPQDGVEGHIAEQQVEALLNRADELGEADGLIHSHNDPRPWPDGQGNVLSPGDYEEGESHNIRVEVYSDNLSTGEYVRGWFDPNTGEGGGTSEPDIDAVSGATPAADPEPEPDVDAVSGADPEYDPDLDGY